MAQPSTLNWQERRIRLIQYILNAFMQAPSLEINITGCQQLFRYGESDRAFGIEHYYGRPHPVELQLNGDELVLPWKFSTNTTLRVHFIFVVEQRSEFNPHSL